MVWPRPRQRPTLVESYSLLPVPGRLFVNKAHIIVDLRYCLKVFDFPSWCCRLEEEGLNRPRTGWQGAGPRSSSGRCMIGMRRIQLSVNAASSWSCFEENLSRLLMLGVEIGILASVGVAVAVFEFLPLCTLLLE